MPEDPAMMGYSIYMGILLVSVPLLLAAAWLQVCEGSGRTLAWVGVGAGVLGWVTACVPFSGGFMIGELFGERMETMFTLGSGLLGLGLILALLGVALSAEGMTRTMAFAAAGLAAVTTGLLTFAGIEGGATRIIAVLNLVAGALPAVAPLTDKGDLPARDDAETLPWPEALQGAQRFGNTVAAFVIMGLILGRAVNVIGGDQDMLDFLTGVESLISLVLLVFAALGLAKLARCPDPSARTLAMIGSVGAWMAAGAVVASFLLAAATAAGVVTSEYGYGPGPGEVLGMFSSLQTAGWLLAVLGLLAAVARIARVHEQRSLAITSVIVAVVFCASSFMLASLELAMYDEPSVATIAIASVLALAGVIGVLVVIGRAAKLASP